MRKKFLTAIVRNFEIYSHIVIQKMILYTRHPSNFLQKKLAGKSREVFLGKALSAVSLGMYETREQSL